jgi:hypothetical protein
MNSPYLMVTSCWAVHGAGLILLPLCAVLGSGTIAEPDWAEAMGLLSAEALVEPTRLLISVIVEHAWTIAGLGILCLAAVVAAWNGRRRWPLQALAWLHLVLLVPLCWWNHLLMLRFGLGTGGALISDAFLAITTLAGLVLSLAVVARSPAPSH